MENEIFQESNENPETQHAPENEQSVAQQQSISGVSVSGAETDIQSQSHEDESPQKPVSTERLQERIEEETLPGETIAQEQPAVSVNEESSEQISDTVEQIPSSALASPTEQPPLGAASPAPPLRELTQEEAHWNELKSAYKDRTILELRILHRVKGGAVLDYKGLDVFLPFSHWHIDPVFHETDIDPFLGKMIPVHIVEISSFAKKRAIASRRKILLKERIGDIEPGMVLHGKVSVVTEFGAFVNLGGVQGLVHLSHLAPYRIHKPADVVKTGQEVTVKVLRIEPKRGRISLSMKDFIPSPWKGIAERYPVNSIHKATVSLIKKYGMFLQLEQGIEGFVHISELSWTQRVKSPADLFKTGDTVETRVLEVNEDKQRIELSVKRVSANPWEGIAQHFHPGMIVDAKIKELVEKGAVVVLPNELNAFLPHSKMSRRRNEPPAEFHAGDAVKVKIIELNVEKQFIIVAVPFEQDRKRERAPNKEMPEQPRHSATLGEMLSEKIKQKLRLR